ncbi:alpha/beta fold hydrolase [Humisphaera borealis]|uniref:Uncharacterized protein n=1 Tax=Humisphaera borealis TaxID=2807512 RepID=A0A7M2WQI8_9BACT|nr:hypothetical protein [Humisphaera borealis]QOV87805.1 hypothetical protein IPV69_16115 [Humisphaera borealis]
MPRPARLRRLAFTLIAWLGIGAGLSAVGRADLPDPMRVDSKDAYILHVPGIAGEAGIDHFLIGGLKDGGFKGKAEIYDWTGDEKGLKALMNRRRADEEAAKVAEKVIAFRKANPKGQIMLTGHSAGTGVIIFALEKLPKDVKVDGALLLSPALSPDYDLSSALSHVTGRVYVFSSTLDYFVLGLGTKLFGTIDRKNGDSAGRVGFIQPANAADPKQYEKLVSCPYEKGWLKFGNIGDHVSVMSRTFSRHILSPLVLSHLPGGGLPLTRPVTPEPTPTTKPSE